MNAVNMPVSAIPIGTEQFDSSTIQPDRKEVTELATMVGSIFSGKNLAVVGKTSLAKVGATTDVSVPELDEADVDETTIDEDLEKLIALLTLENEEAQAEEIQKRIKSLVDKIQAKHDNIIKKVEEAINKAVEQAEKQKRNKILGWIMTALAVVAAIVTTVATFGGAAPAGAALVVGVVGCVCAGLGATVSLATSIMSETGAMEDIRDYFARKYMKADPSLTEEEAKAEFDKRWGIGMAVVQGVLALASLGTGIANMAIAGKEATNLALRGIQLALQGAGTVGGGVSLGFQWDMLYTDRDAKELEAELTLLQKYLDIIQQRLEEEQDALLLILQQIQQSLSAVVSLMAADGEIADSIIEQFGVRG